MNALLSQSVDGLITQGLLPPGDYPIPVVESPKQAEHGDFAVTFALASAKVAGMNPRQVGELLATALQATDTFESVEVAGPGFVNLRVKPNKFEGSLAEVLNSTDKRILEKPGHFARPAQPHPHRINVEFVSVNPNGPITIGSGRGAAYGSALCNLLEASGHTVHREYYINDGVNSEQMRQFALSVRALKLGTEFPEKGYRGDYVQAVADVLDTAEDHPTEWWQSEAQATMLERQRRDLEAFGVVFDTWFSEQSLHDAGIVAECLNELIAKGAADDEPRRTVLKMGKKGAIEEVVREDQPQDEDDAEGSERTVWLRSTKFGDDMDRVLRRRDGRLTYIASDVAYHRDKFNRPSSADRLITVLGPDHHGYINRLRAVVAAMRMSPSEPNGVPAFGEAAELFRDQAEQASCEAATRQAEKELLVQIFQLVRFLKDGKPAPMRKRDGNIFALSDLVDEIGQRLHPDADRKTQQQAGRDVARFFYLMRHHDTTFDFDLDLAAKQSDENPVFYVQYAHARICQLIDRAKTEIPGVIPDVTAADLGIREVSLTELHERERSLLIKVFELREEVARAAEDLAVNRIATYAIELARAYHGFYDQCRVIDAAQPDVSKKRLAIVLATQTALRAALDLLGVSAPERM
ncbi:MAG: arginine--tRNA ligase [Fimbriimonadaceae bacterium]|nr:arginine--tRNA ligase [Fimbriimonadaceae bacterium]